MPLDTNRYTMGATNPDASPNTAVVARLASYRSATSCLNCGDGVSSANNVRCGVKLIAALCPDCGCGFGLNSCHDGNACLKRDPFAINARCAAGAVTPSPINGATGQLATVALTLTFADDIDPASVGIDTCRLWNNTDKVYHPITSATLVAKVITMVKTSNLLTPKTYAFSVGVTDVDGNYTTCNTSFST